MYAGLDIEDRVKNFLSNHNQYHNTNYQLNEISIVKET